MTSLEPGFEHLNVVAIFFWGRSGSVYLHSLFDSHPEVLTLPASRLNGFHGWQWPRISREHGAEAMARCFIECNPSLFDGRQDRWFEGLDTLGPDRNTPLWVDTQAFTRELVRLLAGSPPTRRRFFLAAHVAYALARGEDVSRKTTVIYHLHSPEAYPAIEAALADFPGLRGIGTLREPVRSLLSYLRKNVSVARVWGYADRSQYTQLAPTGAYNFAYRHQLIGWRELQARQPLPFYRVRIEDINRDIEGQMRALAAWLNLSWDARLTQSTFNGLAYNGEKLPSQDRSGAAAVPSAEEADAALDALDRYVLGGLLWRYLRDFEYGRTSKLQRLLTPLLVLAPTRIERRALRASRPWSPGSRAASPGVPSARATLQQMLVRQAFSYRHLLCEAVPALRAHLPAPQPLSAGLSLPRQ